MKNEGNKKFKLYYIKINLDLKKIIKKYIKNNCVWNDMEYLKLLKISCKELNVIYIKDWYYGPIVCDNNENIQILNFGDFCYESYFKEYIESTINNFISGFDNGILNTENFMIGTGGEIEGIKECYLKALAKIKNENLIEIIEIIKKDIIRKKDCCKIELELAKEEYEKKIKEMKEYEEELEEYKNILRSINNE